MGDRVAVLADGILQQCDSPRTMYDRPANKFVAEFIGSPAMNPLSLPLHEDGIRFGGSTVKISRAAREAAGGSTVTLGIRPEHLDFHAAHSDKGLPVTFYSVEELGSDGFAYGNLDLGNGESEPLTVRTYGREEGLRGKTIRVIPRQEDIHPFHTATGERLPDRSVRPHNAPEGPGTVDDRSGAAVRGPGPLPRRRAVLKDILRKFCFGSTLAACDRSASPSRSPTCPG